MRHLCRPPFLPLPCDLCLVFCCTIVDRKSALCVGVLHCVAVLSCCPFRVLSCGVARLVVAVAGAVAGAGVGAVAVAGAVFLWDAVSR
jgi:hypothetical protein